MLITCILTSAAASDPASGAPPNSAFMSTMHVSAHKTPGWLPRPAYSELTAERPPEPRFRRVSKGYDFVGDKGTVGSDGTIHFYPGPDPRDTCDGAQTLQ